MPAAKKDTRAKPEPPSMRFVVTGSARSGTKYVAHLLTRAGIATGHEDVFNRWNEDGSLPGDWRDDAYDGDASFVASPHTAQLAEDLTIVHLVRSPLAVIGSIGGMGWLRDLDVPWVHYISRYVPEVAEQPPGPRRAAAYWLGWNALAEAHAHLTWRLGRIGPDEIGELANRIGVKTTATRANAAVTRTSTTMNHRGPVNQVELGDLGPFAERVEAAAERYGVPLS